MKSAQAVHEEINNRLVNPPQYQPTNGPLYVELMKALQAAHVKAKENPKEAVLNKTSMSDNNGGRIIYTLNDFA